MKKVWVSACDSLFGGLTICDHVTDENDNVEPVTFDTEAEAQADLEGEIESFMAAEPERDDTPFDDDVVVEAWLDGDRLFHVGPDDTVGREFSYSWR